MNVGSRFFSAATLLIVSIFLFPIFLFSQVTTSFDTPDSLEGWRAVGDGIFYFEQGTGNPGNCMRVDDDASGNLLFALAPAKFLGDWSAASEADSISADIFLHQMNGSPFNPDWVFRISGPGGSAVTLQGAAYAPPSDAWTHFSAPLDSTQWTIQQGNWQAILQHVSMLEILTEYITGDEYVRLDNPALTFTPGISDVVPPVYTEFDDGSWEGWSFINTAGVSIQSSGGNPQGYVRISDQNNQLSQAIASSVYLGNWQGLTDAAAIQLDLKILNYSGNFLTNHSLIQISGPGGVASVPMDSSLLEAVSQWQSYSFLLNPTVWTVESGDWNALLDNVTDISVFPEFYDGSESIGFDNFRLSNDPPEVTFEADVVYSFPGDPIRFSQNTRFVPTSWEWSFGDGTTSQMPNPEHSYTSPGTYDVQLIAENAFGADTLLKENYIEIASVTDSLLFYDDFDNDTIHPAWQFRNGSWVENDGIMKQTSNYYTGGYIGGAYAIAGSRMWSDYTLSADFSSADNDKIGFVFRYQDSQNFYLFTWQQQGSLRFIKRFVDGVETDLSVDSVAYVSNTWYHIEIVTEDSLFKCYIDSSLVFEVTDTSFSSGKAGLYCHGNTGSYWDNFSISQTNYTPTGIEFQPAAASVSGYRLYQNYPNPFNPATRIGFYLPKGGEVAVNIYNVLGQRVAAFAPGRLAAGEHAFTWDGTNRNGQPVSSGLYFYELRTGGFHQVKKMFLMR